MAGKLVEWSLVAGATLRATTHPPAASDDPVEYLLTRRRGRLSSGRRKPVNRLRKVESVVESRGSKRRMRNMGLDAGRCR
jgi:hypothetical protein